MIHQQVFVNVIPDFLVKNVKTLLALLIVVAKENVKKECAIAMKAFMVLVVNTNSVKLIALREEFVKMDSVIVIMVITFLKYRFHRKYL